MGDWHQTIRHGMFTEKPRPTMFNCGYDPTCNGWIIREGSPQGEHIATCRSEKLANEFVELFNRRVPQRSDEHA
jgi:hypothetical protein